MRLAWLLLAIPGVYAQSMFDPIKDLAISLGPENINLLLTFWISYLILNSAIKLTPIFGSNSAHNQGGSIAAAMAAATTYFVYITGFNFIGAIMPFIVFLVVGALILLISKLFGETGGFKSGRLIVTGILMILISLTLMGSASLYTTAILGSTLSWLPETIFAIGIVLIMLGGVMTLKAPTGDSNITDSNITDSDILKAEGKPFGWSWRKTGEKLWNRFRGTPEEAPAPEVNTTSREETPSQVVTPNQNQELRDGVIMAHPENILPKIKEYSSELFTTTDEFGESIDELIKEFTEDTVLIDQIQTKLSEIKQILRNIQALIFVTEKDLGDLENIEKYLNQWSVKYSTLSSESTTQMWFSARKDFERLNELFNIHRSRKQRDVSKLKSVIGPKEINILLNGKVIDSNALISESREIETDLQLLSREIMSLDLSLKEFNKFDDKVRQGFEIMHTTSNSMSKNINSLINSTGMILSLAIKQEEIMRRYSSISNSYNKATEIQNKFINS